MRSLLKRDPRNANSSLGRMLFGGTVAVLHAVWKRGIGEMKKLGNVILDSFNCKEGIIEIFGEIPFEKGS